MELQEIRKHTILEKNKAVKLTLINLIYMKYLGQENPQRQKTHQWFPGAERMREWGFCG